MPLIRSLGHLVAVVMLSMVVGCQSNRADAPEPLIYYTLTDGTHIAGLLPVPKAEAYNYELLTDGRGEIYWPNGDPYGRVHYTGDIQAAMAHGAGTMHWQNRRYEGALKWGKPHGEGVMTFHDGRILEGPSATASTSPQDGTCINWTSIP